MNGNDHNALSSDLDWPLSKNERVNGWEVIFSGHDSPADRSSVEYHYLTNTKSNELIKRVRVEFPDGVSCEDHPINMFDLAEDYLFFASVSHLVIDGNKVELTKLPEPMHWMIDYALSLAVSVARQSNSGDYGANFERDQFIYELVQKGVTNDRIIELLVDKAGDRNWKTFTTHQSVRDAIDRYHKSRCIFEAKPSRNGGRPRGT